MHYHILLTERCNSECRYCYEKSLREAELQTDIGKKFKFDFSSPESSKVDVKVLKRFLDKDKDAALIFYGGEPLLEIPKIKEIMDAMDLPFRMQTNGKLLHKLPMPYLKRIGKILVSIDGNRDRTDLNKGKGTYDLVMKNLRRARQLGYRGEIVARMTISPEAGASDLYNQVMHITDLIREGVFDSVHWQIDAGFYKFDYKKQRFTKFAEEYNKSITKLIDFWVNEMKTNGIVHKLYPFIAIADSLLKNEKTPLRCGAGHSGFAITTDSKIVACPIMNCIEDFKAGTINDNPKSLAKFDVAGFSSDCRKCSHLDICGGRCLYWRAAKLWPTDGNELICMTIKHYIDELKKKMPEIKEMIKEGKISEKDFEYEKYFGPEIIP